MWMNIISFDMNQDKHYSKIIKKLKDTQESITINQKGWGWGLIKMPPKLPKENI